MSTNSGDEANVRQAALDYIEGWFDGDAERMARSLHDKLTKRTMRTNPDTGEKFLNLLTKDRMVDYTRQGGGKDVPHDKVYYEVDVIEIDGDIAVARVESYGYLDHLHLVKEAGRWQIVNVIYNNKRTDENR